MAKDQDTKQLAPFYAEGASYALDLVRFGASGEKKMVELFIHVASMESEDAAKRFVDGYKEKLDAVVKGEVKIENVDKVTAKELAENLLQHPARMNRVIRAVYGWNTKDKVTGKAVHHKGYGQEKTLKILNGPGRWMDKIGQLPSTRPETPKDVENPIQRRINAATGAGVQSSHEVLAAVMGIRAGGEGKKEIKEADVPSLTMKALVAAIKASPDSFLGDAAEALISRMIQSSDKYWQNVGIKFREVWSATAQEQADADRAKGKTPKARKPATTESGKA
jgi:hypothetical protein